MSLAQRTLTVIDVVEEVAGNGEVADRLDQTSDATLKKILEMIDHANRGHFLACMNQVLFKGLHALGIRSRLNSSHYMNPEK